MAGPSSSVVVAYDASFVGRPPCSAEAWRVQVPVKTYFGAVLSVAVPVQVVGVVSPQVLLGPVERRQHLNY